jgi:uncharacterized protein (TIGR03067 family)
MRRVLPLTLGLALTASLLPAAPAPKDESKDKEKIQGTWEIVSVDLGGFRQPGGAYRGWQFVFKEDKMLRQINGQLNREYTFKLDPTQKLKTIDLTYPIREETGKEIGIYELDGDTLKWCIDNDGLERPTEFNSPANTNVEVVVLKRVKP